jgi:hypothetical protein
MRMALWTGAVVVMLCSGAPAARGDVWDLGTDTDNDSGSDNELIHGLDQVHDMAAQQGGTVEDVDWYSLRHACNASYEILLDGFTGDVANASAAFPAFETIGSDGTTVMALSVPVSGLGVARRINFICLGTVPEVVAYARVSNPVCGLSCVSTDQYHIHFRETTALIPRFNNSSTQVSILVLQNSTAADVSAALVAHDATGTVIAFISVSLTPNQVRTINLATVNAGELAGKSGALKIVSDAPYGALAGKVVALEPATGFTFDTPLTYKAY